MKNLILLIFSLMTMASFSYAQVASSLVPLSNFDVMLSPESTNSFSTVPDPGDVITVISVSGKVKYAKPGSKRFKKLKEGAILDKMGRLKLKKKATIQYLKGGQIQSFKSKGKHAIGSLPASEMTPKGSDDFLAFLSSASGWGGPGGGDGGKTVPRDTTSPGTNAGGHGEGMKLKGVSPRAGKWHLKPTTFKWNTKSETGFTLSIYEGDDDNNPIYSEHTKSNSMIVDVSKIKGIKKGANYQWQVTKDTGVEDVTLRSNRTEISFVDESLATKAITRLEKMDSFKSAPLWHKTLQKAHTLEVAGLYDDAKLVYKSAIKLFPKNELVKSAYGMFKAKVMVK